MSKFNLCSACFYFQPKMLTESKSIPKSCKHEALLKTFGPDAGGFITGTDIIHCDFFTQYNAFCGDVALVDSAGRLCSWVIPQLRDFKNVRCPKLTDNSKNIKIHGLKDGKIESSEGIEYNPF